MRERGFNLIELLIVLVIVGIVMSIAVPNLQSQIVSARTRGVAESIQSGLLLARSEAIRRNALMRFQLVSTMDATCAASATSRLWVVTQFTGVTSPANTRGEPWARCNIKPYSPPDHEEPCPTTPAYTVDTASNPPTAASCTADPFIAYQSSTETAASVDVSATPSSVGSLAGLVVTFGPLGQLAANYDGTTMQAATTATISVGPSSGVEGRRYRVQVNANGTVRFCNPDLDSSNAMAC
ncbi:MAG: GspH/FimT family pseudopilin [Sulfuritalea sp.]|jgi:type IV fimbrial biogenesis protein FimT|nr:GspH/FimT family pseudopilin [Sulfuritalea sp.]